MSAALVRTGQTCAGTAEQNRGNSGVYLQERYELQVLESFGDTTLANNEAGAIYLKKAPDRNMAAAPGTWPGTTPGP